MLKTLLKNVHEFSPFQLAIGQNPSLPCAFTGKPPALSMTQYSKIIRDYLNIIHKAQEALIMNKNSEQIRTALRHKISTSNDNIFGTRNLYITNEFPTEDGEDQPKF